MKKRSFAQHSRNKTRNRKGQFSEMYRCEKCNKSIGENYYSLPSPGDEICEKLGVFGLSLCTKCMDKLEPEYIKLSNKKTNSLC
jgi:hypothetical protein